MNAYNTSYRAIYVVGLVLAILCFAGCVEGEEEEGGGVVEEGGTNSYTCPPVEEEPPEYIEEGDYRKANGIYEAPFQEFDLEDKYIRIISDSLVELVYERDGEIVVETYEVIERSRRTFER